MRGDWAGSYQAADKARAAAVRPIDQVGLGFDQAWSLFAQGKKAEALKAGDQVAIRRRRQEAGLDFTRSSRSTARPG